MPAYPCADAGGAVPALAAGDRAGRRFLESFAAAIRNPHTRRAYGRAVAEFLAWCGAASRIVKATPRRPRPIARLTSDTEPPKLGESAPPCSRSRGLARH